MDTHRETVYISFTKTGATDAPHGVDTMTNAAATTAAHIPPELDNALLSWLDSRWSIRAKGETSDSFCLAEFLAEQLLSLDISQVQGRPALAMMLGRLDAELESLSEARQEQAARPQHAGPTCCDTDSDNVFAWLDAPGPQVLGRWSWTS